MGDYIDITPVPMFLYDDLNGVWRFNTGEEEFDPTQSYVTFACNRDVIPPSGGLDWTNYWPAGSGDCSQYTAGMRNQNIYSASVTHGILVGSPVNTKPLEQYRRSFLIFVKNLADLDKLIRLTIDAPEVMEASFWEVEAPQGEECPFSYCKPDGSMVEVSIYPHSSITLTVFVQPYADPLATFRVIVEEIEEPGGNTTGLRSAVVLNPDPVNTQFIPVEEETHNPSIIIEEPDLMYLSDPTMLSDPIVYVPYLEELLNFSNPDIVVATSAQNPRIRNPRIRNDTIINPRLRNTAVGSMPEGEVTDLRWTIKNDGNTPSAYSFEGIGEYPSVPHQLLIHRVTSTPVSPEQCLLSEEEHHELLLSIENPRLRNPRLRNPRLRNPRLRNNTFFLAPGEEAVVTLRLIDPKNPHPFDPEFYAKTVAGAAIPQAANPNGEIETAAFMWIYTTTLPDGSVNDPYPLPEPTPERPEPDTHLEAEGGEAPYSWSLVPGYGDLPPGLILDSNGLIHGKPSYDESVTYPKTYNFAVQATDNNGQIAYRNLSIKVYCEFYTITAAAGEMDGNGVLIPYDDGAGPGGSISPCCSETVAQGEEATFTITADECYKLDVVTDGTSNGPLGIHTFTNVRSNHTIEAIFEKITYTITATAGGGGEISPSGDVIVGCRESQMFTITPNSCYIVSDVLVDGQSVGDVSSYTFNEVDSNHTIHADFMLLTYTITATAGELDDSGNFNEYPNGSGQGGSIVPANDTTVNCGASQTFTISTNEGYLLADILVSAPAEIIEIITEGPVTTCTFFNVQDNYTIEGIFIKLEAWVKRYNNDPVNGNDEARDMVFNNFSGNIYVTGVSLGSPTGPDFYTTSYDSDGTEGLSERYDGPAHDGDYANAIAVDGEGNVYMTGYSYRGMPGSKHKDYAIVKYNSSSKLVWDDRYDARRNGDDEATAIAVDSGGNVYITGSSEESLSKKSDVLHNDFYTIKYIPGRKESMIPDWGARYNNEAANGADKATGIAIDEAGMVYVTGFSYNGTDNDIVTIKYDPNGNPIWSDEDTGKVRRYDSGPGLNDEATDIVVKAGFVYVTGRSQSSGKDFDYITIKYDINGNFQWAQKYNNSIVNGKDEAAAVVVDAEGYVYITGRSEGSGTGYDYVTIKYDSNGNLDWDDVRRHDGGNGTDEATDIAIDLAGNVYVTGSSQGWNQDQNKSTGYDYFTIKYDSSGNMIWRSRYNNSPADLNDEATTIVVDSAGNVYVTGRSEGTGTGFDFATVKYEQQIEQNTP